MIMRSFRKSYPFIIKVVLAQILLIPWSAETMAQTRRFTDLESHWAQSCIETLADQEIVGSDAEQQQFRPDAAITRVEFAVILAAAFPDVEAVQEPMDFVDIPDDYWAYSAIQAVNRRGFLSSYIAGVFNPTIEVTRVQALEALTRGLNYQNQQISAEQLLSLFEDGAEIGEDSRSAIAAAAENQLVVNYPNVKQLNPNQSATRAEAAAFICQALVKSQEQAVIPQQYIARLSGNETPISLGESEQTTSESNIAAADLEVNRNRSDQQIELSDSDEVKVELFYQSSDILEVIITRKSERKLSQLIALNIIENSAKTAKVVDINILNLDENQEPEIMIDFVIRDQKNRPFYYSVIYRYSDFTQQYKSVKHIWGTLPYQKQISSINNLPIFISYDRRFSDYYNSMLAQHLPIQIWQYQGNQMVEQTASYPEQVEKQIAILWLQLNNQFSLSQQDLQGMMAAYIANKSILGETEEGWQRVQQFYQGNDAPIFFNQLRQFLQQTGYL